VKRSAAPARVWAIKQQSRASRVNGSSGLPFSQRLFELCFLGLSGAYSGSQSRQLRGLCIQQLSVSTFSKRGRLMPVPERLAPDAHVASKLRVIQFTLDCLRRCVRKGENGSPTSD
jgi:hypothetical protein